MPGEGRVRWKEVFQLLAEKGYGGYLSYEGAQSRALGAPAARRSAREAAAATRRLLAQVE